jgi:hypothetical protein
MVLQPWSLTVRFSQPKRCMYGAHYHTRARLHNTRLLQSLVTWLLDLST